MKSELARVAGSPVRLYRATVEQRSVDWLPWEFVDASLLYDSVMECLVAAKELQELYQCGFVVAPRETVSK
jgi:hypothetical protein